MTQELVKVLKEWKLKSKANGNDFVFANEAGNSIDPRNLVRRMFQPMVKRAGLEQKITKDNYYQVENKLSLKITDKEKLIKDIDKTLRELRKIQKEHQEAIAYDFEASKMSFKIKFSDVNIDDRAFLNFTGIYNSGATNNEEFFIIYMIYIKLLMKYSIIEMPLGIDSTIKDELDINNIKRFYEVMDKNILNTNKQSFVVMLKDKLNYLKENDYNLVHIKKPILDKNKYEELKDEFSVIFAE